MCCLFLEALYFVRVVSFVHSQCLCCCVVLAVMYFALCTIKYHEFQFSFRLPADVALEVGAEVSAEAVFAGLL